MIFNKELVMRPFQIAALISIVSLSTLNSTLAANTKSNEGRMAKTGDAIKRGVMWGPKKIGAGMKSMGEKTKKAFHHQ
jgi:hypothetical protein